MDTSVLEPFLRDVPSWVSAIVALLALGSVVLWIFHRTVSLHVFRLRVWRLFHGRGEITDPAIRAYIDERTNAQAFAFFSGVRALPTRSPAQLVAWCEARKMRPHTLGYCDVYFDLETMSLTGKSPWVWWNLSMAVATWLALCFTGWLLLAQPQTTLLSFKDNGTHFWADKDSVRTPGQKIPFLNDHEPLTVPQCKKADAQWETLAQRTGFSPSDTERLCEALQEKEAWHAFIAKSVALPTGTLLTLMAAMAFFLLQFLLSSRTAFAIRHVRQCLEEHAGVMGPPSPGLQRKWRRQAMGV